MSIATDIASSGWSPATTPTPDIDPADLVTFRETIAHAAALSGKATIIVSDAHPALIAWVQSQPYATLSYASEGQYMSAHAFVHGVSVSASARPGERGWIEPQEVAA